MCPNVNKHRSFHLLISTTFRGLCGSSTYLWYIGNPLSNCCALKNTTMDLSSYIPCVYRDTPLATWNQLSKLFNSLVVVVVH